MEAKDFSSSDAWLRYKFERASRLEEIEALQRKLIKEAKARKFLERLWLGLYAVCWGLVFALIAAK